MSDIDTGYQLRPLEIEIKNFLENRVPVTDRNPLDELLVEALLDAVKESDEERETVQATIERWTSDVSKWATLLPQLRQEVDTWYLRQAQHERYSEAWWDKRSGRLYGSFEEDQDQGLKYWLQTFAEALIDWELEICQALVDEQFSFGALSMFVPLLFRSGIEALQIKNYQAAQGMLTYLAQPGQKVSAANTLPPVSRAVLLIFIGRIHMLDGEYEEALPKFELARDVAPRDGRPWAALGRYYQLQQDYDRAISYHEKAIDLSPNQPDGSVGMGLVLEDQEWWAEAEDLFDQAVKCALKYKDPYVALSKLLAPQSGKLFLQLARVLETEAPEVALLAATRAIELEINDQGSYPEWAAYESKGNSLKALSRDEEAAVAYYEAGRRLGWGEEYKKSVGLLRHSLELNQGHQPTYWQLSDNLRMFTNEIESEDERKVVVEEALDIWYRGEELGDIPTPDDSWTYLNLALLFEIQTEWHDAPTEKVTDFWWQALVAIERALLLEREESIRWAYLGRFYRLLKKEWNALAATEVALELDLENVMVREERLIMLTNRGLFDEALEVADSWTNLDATYEPWVRYIKAYIFSRLQRYEEALKLSNDHKAQHYWVNSLRTQCYVMLDQVDGVLREGHAVLKDYEENGTSDWASVGGAALTVAMLDGDSEDLLDKAIDYLKKALDSPYDKYDASVSLGVCYLAKSETFATGQKTLQDAVLLATNVRELDDLENIDFPRILFLARNWEHLQDVEQFLEQLAKEHIKPRREELFEEIMSPEEELEEGKRTLLEQGETDDVAWWGIQAGLARIYMDQGRWREAAETYQLLYKQTNIIPEVIIGLRKAASELHRQAVEYVEIGDHEAAVPLLELSLELAETLDQREKMPQMHGQCAYAEFMQSHLENARYHAAEALQLYHVLGNEDPGVAVGRLALSLIPNAKSYWVLDDRLQTFAEDVDNEALKAEIMDARQYLKGYLDNLYQLAEQELHAPLVPRLALELSPNLIPDGNSSEWPLLKEHIPSLRAQIQKEYGLEIPGVRVRAGGEYSEEDEYLILLDEMPMADGKVESGNSGDIIGHLQVIIRRNLHSFLGVEEVERLLTQWQTSEEGTLLVNAAMPDLKSRLRFARLLRALVRERVPISNSKAILELFQDVDLAGIEVSQAVQTARRQLRDQLPGNDGQSEKILLSAEIETEIASHIQEENGKRFLAMLPEIAGTLLEAIGELAPPPHHEKVLVCRDDRLRPFVRRLIEHTYPDLLVLSQEEIQSL